MNVNRATVDLVKSFEGCYLKAYLCPAGVPTIGYGHTEGVKLGDRITKDEAEDLLAKDLAIFATGISHLVTVPLNENQFGALVSFAFNVGINALKGSTLLKRLNAGIYSAVPDQLMRWNRAGGRELDGLTRRRRAEGELFMRMPCA